MRKHLGIPVVMMLVAAACGSSSDGTEQVSAGAETEAVALSATSTSVLASNSLGTENVKTPPEQVDTATELSSNPNDPSTPMGALCWTRWELARYQLADALDVDIELPPGAERGPNAVAQSLMNSQALTVLAEGTLPTEAQPFADALATHVNQQRAATEAVPVDFEQLPGVEKYVELAEASPDCKRP